MFYGIRKLINAHFNVYGSVHRKNIPISIQQDATLHSLLYLETALHVSGGTSTHHQERIQLYVQHLIFVTPLLLSALYFTNAHMISLCSLVYSLPIQNTVGRVA